LLVLLRGDLPYADLVILAQLVLGLYGLVEFATEILRFLAGSGNAFLEGSHPASQVIAFLQPMLQLLILIAEFLE
jgi:hypothetical protein